MNNSYLKVDEIQVRAKHVPLMYVIYVGTLTLPSAALLSGWWCKQRAWYPALQSGVSTLCSASLSLNKE